MCDPGTVGVISLVLSAAGTAMQVSQAGDAKKDAKKQAALQQQQIEEQRKQAELQAHASAISKARSARIQSARVAAAVGGAGVSGSIMDNPIADLNTSLSGQQAIDKQQTDLQENQFTLASTQADLRAKTAIDQANASIWKSVFGLGKDAMGAYSLYSKTNGNDLPTASDGGVSDLSSYYADMGYDSNGNDPYLSAYDKSQNEYQNEMNAIGS